MMIMPVLRSSLSSLQTIPLLGRSSRFQMATVCPNGMVGRYACNSRSIVRCVTSLHDVVTDRVLSTDCLWHHNHRSPLKRRILNPLSINSTGPEFTSKIYCSQIVRWYTPMSKEEEEKEKARVAHLSPEEKDQELRQLNREIAKLESLKGINTGELYTWSGKYKALMRDYGFPLFVYYWCVWSATGVCMYLAIDVGGLDAMALLAKIDANLGWKLTEMVDPQYGKIGLALLLNEVLEPVRLPFVITTLKPAIDTFSPPKY